MDLIVDFEGARVVSFPSAPVSCLDLKLALASYGCNHDDLCLSMDGLVLEDSQVLSEESADGRIIRCTALIRGGKGGYGAMLRSLAKQSGAKRTTDFGACRDLSGRRLRHVNDEVLLQKWKEAKESGKEFDPNQITQTGINMWFLSTPNWADCKKKPSARQVYMKDRKKVRICLDWERARRDRSAPKGAPVWWGCPRGPKCDYAHGESELPQQAVAELQEARKKERYAQEQQKKQTYISSLDSDSIYQSEGGIAAVVMAGLQAAKKLKTEETASGAREVIAAAGEGEEDILPLDGDGLYIKASASVVHKSQISISETSTDPVMTCVPIDEPMSETVSSWLYAYPVRPGSKAPAGYDAPTVDMNGDISGNGDEGLGSVGVSGCAIQVGNWYYEVELQSNGLVQIGVASNRFQPDPAAGDGVGDDSRSWSFDGVRSLVWHGGHSRSFGAHEATEAGDNYWKAGDIVGVFVSVNSIDSSVGTNEKRKSSTEQRRLVISYSLNGKNLGKAFEEIIEDEDAMFSPAVSLEGSESVRMNIGQRPFAKLTSAEASTYRPVLDALDQIYYDAIAAYIKFCEQFDQSASSASNASVEAPVSTNSSSVAPEPPAPQTFDPINIDDPEFTSPESFERFGMAHLKAELERRGLKSGGTLQERTTRLFLVRGVPADKIDKKLKAKA